MLSPATRDLLWLCYYGHTMAAKLEKAAAIAAERAATVDPELNHTVRLSVPSWCIWCILFDVWIRKSVQAWPVTTDSAIPAAHKRRLWLSKDGQLYSVRPSKRRPNCRSKPIDPEKLDRKSLTELHHVLSRDFIPSLRSGE